MGYQESFIQFESEEVLVQEIKRYKNRDTDNDMVDILCIDRVKKAITPFIEGELVMVVGGQRYEQRNADNLREGLGVENVKSIVFIDNPTYWDMSDGDIGGLLDEHFEKLTNEETERLL